MKDQKAFKVIMKREISAYFSSPIAYIVTGLFLVASGILFFILNAFFITGDASLRPFFYWLPLLFSFFIPAMTMRTIAEEKKTGSIETLLTLPVTVTDVVTGKYLGSLICGAAMLVPTLFYAVTCYVFGSPDTGSLICGYLGALFLLAAFCAIGLFATSITKNQIIAFFVSCAVCLAITKATWLLSYILPGSIVTFLNYFSAENHFESVTKGIIDTRDLVYFASVTVIFLTFTVRTLEKNRSSR